MASAAVGAESQPNASFGTAFEFTGSGVSLAAGLTGKERRIGYTFRTTVENLRDQKVDLIVQDRLPVSEDDRIEVQSGKGMTAGFREVKNRPGIIEWTLPLAPREKREVLLVYSVRVPKEVVIASATAN